LAILVLKQGELPKDVVSRDFVGEDHGGVGACVLFVDAKVGEGGVNYNGPALADAAPGPIRIGVFGPDAVGVAARMSALLVPPRSAGSLANNGLTCGRSTSISLRFETEWLAGESARPGVDAAKRTEVADGAAQGSIKVGEGKVRFKQLAGPTRR
jgi:hypothetical protein